MEVASATITQSPSTETLLSELSMLLCSSLKVTKRKETNFSSVTKSHSPRGSGTQLKWKSHLQLLWFLQLSWWSGVELILMLLSFQLHSNGSWWWAIKWQASSTILVILRVRWSQSRESSSFWKFHMKTLINLDMKMNNGQERDRSKWRTSS